MLSMHSGKECTVQQQSQGKVIDFEESGLLQGMSETWT